MQTFQSGQDRFCQNWEEGQKVLFGLLASLFDGADCQEKGKPVIVVKVQVLGPVMRELGSDSIININLIHKISHLYWISAR